ncbi:MAG: hypothetical protein WC236_14650 [Gallionellaceae bacterium]|jgi:hypothetical protein
MRKCIEIELNEDGTFMVAECEPKEEAAEQPVPGLPMENEEAGQTFQTLDEALQAAKQLLIQTPEGVAAEQEAQAGFDSVQKPMKGGMQ